MKAVLGNKDTKSSTVWLLLIGVAFNTIYFKIDFEDPFNTPKLIILIILSSWITGHLINSYRDQGLILKSSDFKVLVLALIFIITLLISTLLTDIPLVGFIGDTQRRNGFLAYLGLTVILIYASRVINFKYISRVFKVAIITGLILSSYGLIQSSGNDFVKWNNPHNAMIATLGNPNFASAMLAILTLLAIFSLFMKFISPFFKIIGVSVTIMSLVAIIDSQSRQGLVTLFFGVAFFISVFVYFNHKKIALIVMPLSIITAIFVILGMLQKGPLTYLLYKDSVSTRGYYWRAGIEMLKSEPFTGVGIDRYGAYFKQFREVAYPLKYGFEINSSNAHNTIIQIFSTAGLFVGVSYLLILGYIFFSGLKLVKNTEADQQKIALALLATWIGFQAQ
jgi:O-antigen ligase